MARCTAPVRGHRSSAAAADCPACGGRYGRSRSYGSGYSGYGGGYSSYSPPPPPRRFSSGGSGSSNKTSKPRWSSSSSTVYYTPSQVAVLTPVREQVEALAVTEPDLRDVFLCHAWDDRQGVARELHDQLESIGVKVWFSEKDIPLGAPMMRAIDKGLANSRVGIVLVTPAMLKRLPAEGVADKELSALLHTNRLVPIAHDTTFDQLNNVSPLLASRAGLSTSEETMSEVAAKISELVKVFAQD